MTKITVFFNFGNQIFIISKFFLWCNWKFVSLVNEVSTLNKYSYLVGSEPKRVIF